MQSSSPVVQLTLAARWLALCLAMVCGGVAAQPATGAAALEVAAQRGDVTALITLAGKYELGEDVAQDFARSNALYCKAAARGNAEATLKLGQIYSSGREMIPNEGVGALLIHKAAELGSERAKELLPLISRGVGSVLPACMTEPIAPPAALTSTPAARKGIELLVEYWAPQYSVDPQLVIALIGVESRFDAAAVSPRNAQGLMQLIPATATRFGVKNAFNALENLKGGLAYLRWLMAYFQGDVALALAAYNAGEEAVERYRGIPPYKETRDYVTQVMRVYKKASHPYLAEIAAPSSVLGRIKRVE